VELPDIPIKGIWPRGRYRSSERSLPAITRLPAIPAGFRKIPKTRGCLDCGRIIGSRKCSYRPFDKTRLKLQQAEDRKPLTQVLIFVDKDGSDICVEVLHQWHLTPLISSDAN
jgi:hypothetical protein